jgi:hypothetical protein
LKQDDQAAALPAALLFVPKKAAAVFSRKKWLSAQL